MRRLASWCRANSREASLAAQVPGPNATEQAQLAALGGVSRSLMGPLADGAGPLLPRAVAEWAADTPLLPPELLEPLKASLGRRVDPLALLYERLVAAPRRRPLGTFFTPPDISSYMQKLVEQRIPRPPMAVIDPGAGVGAFTRAALEAWPDARIHAVDINVATLGLLAATPQITASLPNQVSLHHADFLDWTLRELPAVPGPRLIWGNPPYTRHQGLAREAKALAKKASGDLAPGGRAGLSTYFLAASLAHLDPADSLCLLLPSNWLEADYARNLRRYLWNAKERPVELHIFPHALNLFPIASVAAMVLWVGPANSTVNKLHVIRLKGELGSGFYRATSQDVRREGAPPKSFLFVTSSHSKLRQKTVPLASIAHIRRGVATGCNQFFLLTDEQVAKLPGTAYVPAATRLRDIPTDHLDETAHDTMGDQGLRRWLLWLSEQDTSDPIVHQLLEQGKLKGVPDAYLCRARNPWYAVERIPAPDLLFGPMSKGRFRLILNSVKAIPTNTFYGIRIRRAPRTVESIALLASWISGPAGQDALANASRQHGSGTLKIEPRDLADLQIPIQIAQALD
ncbi:Methyltransferase domain-containing protein [Micromonospora halophytica]|uniref:site-specific DNA-methyltransferase (adenine-specific) n=2 Tax=Micromonospora halophytica TaxID=47864 RepID=A0A1C5JCX5_9ACTN|nr:Methyltransferase domain-containing protein [Micromonospora halophytica]